MLPRASANPHRNLNNRSTPRVDDKRKVGWQLSGKGGIGQVDTLLIALHLDVKTR